MKITAAVIREANTDFSLEELELEEPRASELIVKVIGVGICHTDISFQQQQIPSPLPAVYGHEGSGVVEQVGKNVTEFGIGDHVVMSYAYCGKCEPCITGKPFRCVSAMALNFGCARSDGTSPLSSEDGCIHGSFFGQSSFANYALVDEKSVVKVPKDVPLEILGPLGCGIQTGSGAVINTLAPKAGSSIAIFGCGAVGLSAVMAAHLVGCSKIIAIDMQESRLAMAKKLGATHIVTANDTNATEFIHGLTGIGADYSVECTGVPAVFRQAEESIAAHGVCALVGASPLGTDASFDMNGIMLGRTIKGVVEGDAVAKSYIPKLIELYQQGRFPFDELISTYDFNDINKAVADLEKGDVIKAVLKL